MPTKGATLTALSYAAILTVYAAGYERTRDAADRFLVDIPTATPFQLTRPSGATVTSTRPPAAPPVMAPAPAAPAREVENPARSELTQAPKTPEPESVVAEAAPPAIAPAPAPAPEISAAPPTPAPVEAAPPPAPAPVIAPAPAPAPAPAAMAAPPPAPVAAAPPPPPPPPAPIVLKNGKYRASGSCRHGDIEAEIEIARGMLVDVKITACKVQYDCGDLYELNEGILAKQGPTVDYVAGATQSTIAFYTAVFNAIDKAK